MPDCIVLTPDWTLHPLADRHALTRFINKRNAGRADNDKEIDGPIKGRLHRMLGYYEKDGYEHGMVRGKGGTCYHRLSAVQWLLHEETRELVPLAGTVEEKFEW